MYEGADRPRLTYRSEDGEGSVAVKLFFFNCFFVLLYKLVLCSVDDVGRRELVYRDIALCIRVIVIILPC